MNRNGHIFQPVPRIGNGIVIIMIGINPVRMFRIAFATEEMKAAVGEDPVYATPRP